MSKIGYKNNKEFYKKVIKRYGISPRGVHWNSKESQYIRFEILSKFIKDDIKESVIVDAGCGFGEYYNYLFDNNLKPKIYIGLDCEEEMINSASKRFLNTNFFIKNILEDELINADYYICSGAMNILNEKEVLLFIQRCYNTSNKGFIFNFLKQDSFNKVEINTVLEFCKSLCPKINIKDNYLENDISIFLKK